MAMAKRPKPTKIAEKRNQQSDRKELFFRPQTIR